MNFGDRLLELWGKITTFVHHKFGYKGLWWHPIEAAC